MTRRAFTLIELLVVIAVIALLIGILLPSLGRARNLGRRTVCQAHVRGVVGAMAAYEGENKGAIVGPNSSGADLHAGRPYVPGEATPCQDWDFVSPLLGSSMRFPTDQLGKFEQICMTSLRCPSNKVRYTQRFAGAPLPIEQKGMHPFTLSYLTPAYFQLYPAGTVMDRPIETNPASEPIELPKGYSPKTHSIGPFPFRKIFAFEGARYWYPAINGFDYSTVTNGSGLAGSPQGNFLSRGNAFLGSGENYLREASNGFKPALILKQISLRHDERMNAGMFDGHVESLDNVRSADPSHYAPSRSRLTQPWLCWYFNLGPPDNPYRKTNAIIP